jgi:hypothetical protein
MLLGLFTVALGGESHNVVETVRNLIQQAKLQLATAKAQATQKRGRLIKLDKKIKCKAGENLAQMLIEQQLRDVDAQLVRIARGEEVSKHLTLMVEAYVHEGAEAPSPTVFSGGGFTSAWAGFR